MTLQLQTDRMMLRPFLESDLADYFEIVGNPNSAIAAGFQTARTMEDAQFMLRRAMTTGMVYALVERRTQKVIGSIGLYEKMGSDGSPIYDESELGYVLNQAFWGRGYMPEAGRTLIDYVSKERLFQRLWASSLDENERSQRVLVKLGFELVDRYQHSDHALYQPGKLELIYQRDLG